MAKRPVYQFKISLDYIQPTIWRRIQLSDLSTFWDLHVAIQDTMGWFDCHLHSFSIKNPNTNKSEMIGIPDSDFEDMMPTEAGWEKKIREYFSEQNSQCIYEYDFGDGWEHIIQFEGIYEKVEGEKYPICLGGENACPPEDVGGYHGYENFVNIMADKKHPEYEEMLEWYGEEYNPRNANINQIKFSNARKRLNNLWADMGI